MVKAWKLKSKQNKVSIPKTDNSVKDVAKEEAKIEASKPLYLERYE